MAADSQQQAGTSQGEQLIKLIRATEPQVQTGSAEVNACAYVLPRCYADYDLRPRPTAWAQVKKKKKTLRRL